MRLDRNFVSYLGWFFGTALLLLVVAVGLSIYFKPLSGDLTRIGKWAERDFGPTLFQEYPAIRANDSELTNQQILVLGDSFSHPNIWQSYLSTSSKLNTMTFEFKNVGCIDNWLNWIDSKKAASNLQTVIIEVAERNFVPVFRSVKRCAASTPVASDTSKKTRPSGLMPVITLDATYLLQTLGNAELLRWQEGRINSGDAINVPLSNASLFSNRWSKRLLYYAEDDDKKSWTQIDISTAVENLQKIQKRLEETQFIFVIVPDKSTVYRPYMLDASVYAEYPNLYPFFKASGVNLIDLRTLFEKNVASTTDLYLPNDTHLSPSGYRMMASAIADRLHLAGTK